MNKNKLNNVQLGFFVMAGTLFLIIALYMIGNNRNLFDRTIDISATFYNVNGLMEGNSVRFSGIDVGTVKSVEIASDTSVKVTMVIHRNVQKYIKKTSVASVGTDGLMGNRLVNITTGSGFSPAVEEGDVLVAYKAVETDAMIRILNKTNLNLADITDDLKKITQKLNNSKGLWKILGDTTVAENLRESIRGIRMTSDNAARFTRNLNMLLTDLQQDKGIVNFLLKDTASSRQLRTSLADIQAASEKARTAAGDLSVMTGKMKRGEGAAGVLMSDTVFANDLKKSMRNVRTSTEKLDVNMEAMRHNFLFKGYFKDLEKEQKKAKK
jgi:phospholipid/cholesterol/gamma-HCH transport system substrate-binding protein